MKWFRGKIARALAESFIALAIFCVAMMFVAFYLIRTVSDNYLSAINRTNLALLGSQIREESILVVVLANNYVSMPSDFESRLSLRQEISSRRSNLDRLIEQAVEQTATDDLEERTQLARIQEGVVNLSLQINRLIRAYEEEQSYGMNTDAEMEKLLSVYQRPLENDILVFQQYEANRVQQVQDFVARLTQIILAVMIVLASLAVIIATMFIAWMFRRVIIPLSELHQGVEQLRRGKLDYSLKTFAHDEIGLLAETLNEMAGQLRQTLQGLHANIEQLRQAKDALLRSEEHYRSLYAGVPVGLFRSTQDGKIIDGNPALVSMLAYPSKDVLLSTNAITLYDDPDERNRWLQLADLHGEVKNYETQQKRFDGTLIWTRRTVRAVRDEQSSLLYYEGVLEDITERKKAEHELRSLYAELERRVVERTAELQAANKELEAFAYSVSHDLRTPLRGIDGYSKLLLDEYGHLLVGDGRQYLVNVRQAAQRMGQLIDDLLKLSRVTRTEMNRTQVDLSKLAADTIAALRFHDPSGGSQRQCEVTIQPGLQVSADYNLLRVLMENLLGNAWKFTAKTPHARIEVGVLEQNGQRMYYVRDNGAGFDGRYVDKLFRAFQRLHQADDYEGTGIGLATAQRIVQRHGGSIWAEGRIGEGAIFYFTLPER